MMKFTEIQQKEFIEASDGRMLGFVSDARISKEKGAIEAFMVAQPKKMFEFFSSDNSTISIPLHDIHVIGKDVVLVKRTRHEQG
ncbi:MAG: PRC-barrel domain-containing protein [Paenisporosarcina sp.]